MPSGCRPISSRKWSCSTTSSSPSRRSFRDGGDVQRGSGADLLHVGNRRTRRRILHAHPLRTCARGVHLLPSGRGRRALPHGMGEWAWAAGIAPLLGPWRLGATQFVYRREGGFDSSEQLEVLAPRRHQCVHDAHRDALDDGDRGRGRALSTAFPARLLGRGAAQSGGYPLVSRPVRGHGARLLRRFRSPTPCAPTIRSWRCARDRWGSRCPDGTCRSSTRTRTRSASASAARSACVRDRIPHYPLGYWRNPDATREDFEGEWFPPGRGRDRCRRVLLVRRPRRRRDHLGRIRDRSVRGRVGLHRASRRPRGGGGRLPDERRGDVVKAFIVLAAGSAPSDELAEEIKGFVRGNLSAYAYPRRIEFVSELPKTRWPKIRRIELRESERD